VSREDRLSGEAQFFKSPWREASEKPIPYWPGVTAIVWLIWDDFETDSDSWLGGVSWLQTRRK
jgi:hypothetical protein